MKFKDFMTIKEAAEFLGVTTTTLRAWTNKNKIPTIRNPISRYRLYKKEDLDVVLKSIQPKDQ